MTDCSNPLCVERFNQLLELERENTELRDTVECLVDEALSVRWPDRDDE